MEQNKRKIGILKFAKGDNYGAVLQAYALAEVLRRMGYGVEFFYLTWTTWRHDLAAFVTPLSRRFESFRREYICTFSKECHTKEDLAQASKGLDCCIVGSDQIWNPAITTHRALRYFGDFLPDGVRRFSYAASFGSDSWRFPELTNEVGKLLMRFNALSVRENEGVGICHDVFGCDAVKVLDPTLLLGDFSSLLRNPAFKDAVVGFKFAPSEAYYGVMKTVARELNTFPVLMEGLSKVAFKAGMRIRRSWFPSPQTWVTNIANARFVVTDSFHCMVFAILFKKEFAVIPSNSALQSRMTSLLNDLGLGDRLFSSHQEALDRKIWNKSIDYVEVDKRLENLRENSMSFLRSALS